MKRSFASSVALVAMVAGSARGEPDTFGLGNGHSGTLTVAAANTVINAYVQVTAPVAPGDGTLTVSPVAGLFFAGDLVMVWQSTGVVPIPLSGTPSPFDISGNAVGRWELARVTVAAGTTLTLNAPMVNSFAASVTQVIRVPEYVSVNITAGGLTAPAWNGSTGGVIAFLSQGAVANAGTINVSNDGFRAGQVVQDGAENLGCVGLDGTSGMFRWALKGEGIANTRFGPPANNGMGNVANGGGGGDCNGSGGGGGGNGAQGGIGGNTTKGDTGGSRAVGGLGGSALTYSLFDHLTLGGGGGAGEEDDFAAPAPSGSGGGMVFIRGLSLSGGGFIHSDGQVGTTLALDGSGGGGAGGSMYLRFTGAVACGGITAVGGNGGNTTNPVADPTGPGGGGGGGQVLIQGSPIGALCNPVVVNGTPGTAAGNGNWGAGPAATADGGVVTVPPGGFTIPPVPVLIAPANNSFTGPTPTVSGTDTLNGSTVQVFMDGSNVPTCTAVVAGGAWSCVVGAALTAGVHTVDAVDLYQGCQSLPTAKNTFTVRTVVPNPPVITAPVAGSTVNTSTPTISGTAEPGSTVTVTEGATTLCSVVADPVTGAWSCVSSVLLDGSHTITATAKNAIGTSGASAPDQFYVRTKAPAKPVITAPVAGSTVNTSTPNIVGTGEAGDTINVTEVGLLCTTTVTAAGTWSCASAFLADGSHSVTATATNGFGSTASNPDQFYVRTKAPAMPVITAPVAGSTVNTSTPNIVGTGEAGDTINVTEAGLLCATTVTAAGTWSCASAFLADGTHTVTATATNGFGSTASNPDQFYVRTKAPAIPVITAPVAGSTVNTSTPNIAGTGEAGDTINVTEAGLLCTTTVSAAGTWSCASAFLADGTHTVTATATNGFGSTPSNPDQFYVRTKAPAKPIITAPVAGSTVNTSTPNIVGTGEAGDTINVTEVGLLCTTTVTAAGTWSCASAFLADGTHTVTATATNGFGSTASNPDQFYVRTKAPAKPVITAPVAGSTVNTSTPSIVGTGEAGDTINATEAGLLCTTTVTAAGTWSCASAFLADGTHTVTATATNGFGSTASNPDQFYVRTKAPAIPVITAPVAGSTVNTSTPNIVGTGEAGDTINVTEAGLLCTTTVTAAGTWSCASAFLADGTHTVTATATNGFGSTPSNPDQFYVRTLGPVMPTITAPVAGSTVNTSTPNIVGTGEAGDTITVTEAGLLCTTTVNGAGTWSCASAFLVDGSHTVTATATNGVGGGVASNPDQFYVRTQAPGMPIITAPVAGSTVNVSTPPISGTGEAGDTITVTEGSVLCVTTVTAGGTWSCVSAFLLDGSHTVTATATNGVGSGVASNPDQFYVRTLGPAMPVITAPPAGSTVNSSTPSIAGTGEAGDVITVTEGGVLCITTVTAAGAWSCVSAFLVDGSHTVTATATNGVGGGVASNPDQFYVRTLGPPMPVITAPPPTSSVNSSTPTISGTGEAGDTITVTEGGVLCVTTVTAAGTWSCVSAFLADGSHTVIATAANGVGSGVASSPDQFWVRTLVPAAPVITLPLNGSATNNPQPPISGTAEPGSTVTVTLVPGGAPVCTAVADPTTGAWSCTPTAPLPDGTYTIVATATNGVGTGPASSPVTFTVKTTLPAAPVIVSPANGSYIATRTPIVFGTAPTATTVALTIDGALEGTVAVDSAGNWAYALTPAQSLADGPHTATATATDIANNVSPPSASDTFTVEATLPLAPVITSPTPGQVTGGSPTITGTAAANSTVNVYIDGVLVGTAAVDASGNWSFPLTGTLANGSHTVSATDTNQAGLTGPFSAPVQFTVSTTSLASPIIVSPVFGSTIGTRTPTVIGTAPAGTTVTLTVDLAVVGTASVDVNGNWTYTLTAGQSLVDGVHTASATATDGLGNTSQPSNLDRFTVIGSPPLAPFITAPPNGSTVTTATPIVLGSAQANMMITLTIDGAVVGFAQSDANGDWAVALTGALANGPHTATATATNAAWEVSVASAPDTFVVNVPGSTVAAPVIVTPTDGSLVATATPTISGTAPAGSTVTVVIDGSVSGTALADATGAWSYPVPANQALSEGPHVTTATDVVGGVTSGSSNAVTFTVDLTAPAAPVVTVPANGSTIYTATPTIVGTAEVASTVRVSVDAALLGTVTADSGGHWAYPLTPAQALLDGSHSATATATDAAGNLSPVSNTDTFIVDTKPPAAPVIISPANGSVAPTNPPIIGGTAEAGSTVKVFVDGVLVCTVVANASGAWFCTPPSPEAPGTHTITATATNPAGTSPAATSTFIILGSSDGGTDGGQTDGGATDGGPADAGAVDSGQTDGGASDGGPPDAGLGDGGVNDAGLDLSYRGGGCGCNSFGADGSLLGLVLGLATLARRRRRN